MPTTKQGADATESAPPDPIIGDDIRPLQWEQIDKLIARWEAADYSPALAQAVLAAKISAVYAHVERIPKNGWNDHFKYRFAQESDVSDALRPLFATFRLAVLPSTEFQARTEATTARGNKTALTDVTTTFTWICGDTGAELTTQQPGTGDDASDKGTAKATTSAVKYGLLKAFYIATGDDPDQMGADADPAAEGGSHRASQRAAAGRGGQGQGSSPPRQGRDGQNAPHVITEPQRRALMKLISDLELEKWQAREVIAVEAGVLSTTQIPKTKLADVRASLNGYAASDQAGRERIINAWRDEMAQVEGGPQLVAALDAKIVADKAADTPFAGNEPEGESDG